MNPGSSPILQFYFIIDRMNLLTHFFHKTCDNISPECPPFFIINTRIFRSIGIPCKILSGKFRTFFLSSVQKLYDYQQRSHYHLPDIGNNLMHKHQHHSFSLFHEQYLKQICGHLYEPDLKKLLLFLVLSDVKHLSVRCIFQACFPIPT